MQYSRCRSAGILFGILIQSVHAQDVSVHSSAIAGVVRATAPVAATPSTHRLLRYDKD